MGKRTGPTNPLLKQLIDDLKKTSYKIHSPFLLAVAEKLNKPRRQRVEVNIADINRNANEGDVIIVPGVVLGYGELEKKVTISAWRFSKPALEKIKKSNSIAISIEELVKKNPRGTGVKIMC
ncbi:MAG: 50S ribosomal protein L18e [Candidatus Aenigmarchaeota archaeon]|nr:50S ribosomal protein L18e [Candidatus Aenigmarchaeota archaeon]MBU5688621.1 50S ribosomal protein L18e [Candidatus Aenigmarchaeota archaeon]